MWGFESLKDILDVVMVPIALVLLSTLIAQRWQDRQRDSKTKIELVAEISELVMTTVMTAHLFNTSDKGEDQKQEFERIYKKWRVETCVIGSKIHAYFRDPIEGGKQIHLMWNCFSDRLTKYCEHSRDLDGKMGDDQSKKEKEDLFNEKASIIKDILASKITGFQVGPTP